MKQKAEVLSPAGSMEALVAAVRSGADAVYLGGSSFSARGNAQNFDRSQLKEAVEYCHLAGVKVHLAVNTLLKDNELPEALSLIQYACTLPVDAVIVQDIGLFSLLRTIAPTLPLHCSTQMSLFTKAGTQWAEEQGAARVVLSRELSLKEIRQIADSTSVELEHFVHGALCMCVSGQCYLSAMLGGRSGNRGLCAQPCRLPFLAEGGTGHDLSLKDLSMLPRVQELVQAGVTSCKIEGRMKRPEYVAAATNACRQAMDGVPLDRATLQTLEAVFSRSGFTTGYPDGKLGREMFGTRTYEDVTATTEKTLSQLRQLYHKEMPRVGVTLHLMAKVGKAVTLTLSDGSHTVTAVGQTVEVAENKPLSIERATAQLEKLGGTVFFAQETTADIDYNAMVPLSSLNQLRREGITALSALRKQQPAIPFTPVALDKTTVAKREPPKALAVFARVEEDKRVPDSLLAFQRVFVPLFTEDTVLTALQSRGFSLGVDLPRGYFGQEERVAKRLEQVKALGIAHGRCTTLNSLPLLQKAGFTIHGGFPLNVMNSQGVDFLAQEGVASLELSCELSLLQQSKMTGEIPTGAVVYGRLPLMLTRNCPAKNHRDGCKNCTLQGGSRVPQLMDRKGVTFPILCEKWGSSQVFNSVPLVLYDQIQGISGVSIAVFHFTVENSVEIDEIVHSYQSGTKPSLSYTRGVGKKGVE